MKTRLSIFLGLLLLCCSLTAVSAKKDKPDLEETQFKFLPTNLFYFDDSEVVLLQEGSPGTVYRSATAGESWSAIKDINNQQAVETLRHPFNNQVAITLGSDKTHWITKDQGKTWTSFRTKYNPVMGRPPILFHASDPDRMLFIGGDCLGWDCTQKVG